jgi:transcriptional regulator with XRE-family HTH domain
MQEESQVDSGCLYADDMQTGRPTTTERTDFGTRLHALREAAGLTQQEVAEQLGIAQSSYATWERQTPAIRPDQLEPLAEILGVAVADLFSTKSPPASQHGGPLGRAKRIFESVSALPRKKQKRILDVVEDLLLAHSGSPHSANGQEPHKR